MSEKLIYAERLKKVLEKNFGHTGGAAVLEQLIDIAPAVDAVEVVQNEAVDYGYLADWYIRSVTNDPPVWTEEHIDELFNDFYLIPKGERREK